MKEDKTLKSQQFVNRHKPVATARHWGGLTGSAIPEELKPLVKTHIKKSQNGNYFVNEYDSMWYARNYSDKYGINSFKDIMKVFSPYFSVTRVQYL